MVTQIHKYFWYSLFGLFLFCSLGYSQISTVGGFESDLPSYWTKGSTPAGSSLDWATDESRHMGRSLKINKAVTSDSAAWISENMVDFWSERHFANVDIKLGAWVMTEGVNTNPATADEEWYISYTFLDSSGALIGTTKLPIDQSVASSGTFVADTNAVGETILPEDSWTTIIKFVGGANATGTVWADDFIFIGRDGWAGQDWNTSVGVPTGWTYWLPPVGGNDGELSKGFENTVVTSEESHSGSMSLKFHLPTDRETGDAFVGTRRFLFGDDENPGKTLDLSALQSVSGGDVLRLSVWLKGANLVPDSAAAFPVTWAVGFTYGFWRGNDNNAGFNSIDGFPVDMQFVLPAETSFDWREFKVDITVPDDIEATAISARMHVYSRFEGTIYWDDFSVEKIDVPALTADVGGFESDLPSYWTKGSTPAGSSLDWATDESRHMGRSLKINKAVTSDSAAWISENMVDFWSERHFANVDIKLGAWVMTEGVNTNPATADEEWYISYTFLDSSGALIGTTKLPIDQSVASSGTFVADTNAVGETILPEDSWTTIIKFVGGANATGTVWADDFIFIGRDGWAGQDWNTSVGVPTGWTYWLPPVGGNDGELSKGFENTVVTSEESHSGSMSLKFHLPTDRETGDAFVGTRRFLFGDDENPGKTLDLSALQSVSGGDVLRLSVWLKGANLVPDSAAAFPVTWAVGFTYGFWRGNDNNAGFNSIDGFPVDMQFVLPAETSFDWREFKVDITVPDDIEATAISARMHVYSRFEGTIYWDDFSVEKIDVPALTADVGGFESDLPSYWTKGSTPAGSSLDWATDESRHMGRSLKINKAVTSDSAAWISENMVDFWSERHFANVDIKLGAWVMTEGVNTNPATADEEWYISYTFLDSSGALIGTTKLPIDQSVASSGTFVADTNAVGETILPEDSWTTIIKFVGGANATGTVWADDFIFIGRDGWAGQDWNTSVGVPTGWTYWLPPVGGNDGELSKGFENTVVTSEESHSGSMSLKFHLPTDRETGDAFVGTRRFLFGDDENPGKTLDLSALQSVSGGDVLRLSVWLKGANLVPDSAAAFPVTWAVGFTYGFWRGNDNNAGFNSIDGFPVDMQFVLPAETSFDWREFKVDITVPDDIEATAISARMHVYSRFEGTIYWDDFSVENITLGDDDPLTALENGDDNIPKTLELGNNYPNPFNPSTTIQYGVPHAGDVTINVYNLVGQRINTLVKAPHSAGRYKTFWNGTDYNRNKLSTGIYFYSITTGDVRIVKKMVLVK